MHYCRTFSFSQSQSNTTAAEFLKLLDELALSFANNSAINTTELSNLSESTSIRTSVCYIEQ